MKNRTCGECKHYYDNCGATSPDIIADYCDDFALRTITNGDRIRAMSDEELAEYFIQKNLINLWVTPFIKYGKDTKEEAIAATLEELKRGER